jgi:ABC-type transport system involved in cytochrome bd biosynthesis fused ATPase/permease subunit
VASTLSDTDANQDNTHTGQVCEARTDARAMISFCDVEFHYQELSNQAKVLDKLSFEVYRNEKVAIVGESGKGKTTALNLIIGLLKPQRGKVLFMARILLLSMKLSYALELVTSARIAFSTISP